MPFARRIAFLIIALVSCASASATDPQRTLAQLHHTALRAEDGAPGGATHMAQTEDGWLWLSTRMGLYRYDGFAFEKIDLLPAGSNRTEATWVIYAAPGGDLWVSRADGGAARLRHGDITLYDTAEGLPDHVAIDAFGSDGAGRVWASTETGTYRFDGRRWTDVSAISGIQGYVGEWLEDARGNLWATTENAVYILRKNASRFENVGLGSDEPWELLNHPDGSVWARTRSGIRPLPHEWGQPFPHTEPRRANSTTTIFDAEANLWTVDCATNLCRVAEKDVDAHLTGDVSGPTVQAYSEDLGMTSQATMGVMEDRDGHVWVSTKVGLDTFRDSWLSRVRFPKLEVYFALVEDGQGRTWTGTAAHTGKVDRLWRLTPEPVPIPGFAAPVTTAYRDADGSVWLGGRGTLWHMRDGVPARVPLPEDVEARETIVQAIARDGAGRLWTSLRLRGLYVQDGKRWLPAATVAAFPADAPATIHVDPAGRAWFGYLDGTIAMLDGHVLRRFGTGDGLRQGPIVSIATIDGTLVVGAERGLSLFDGKRFRQVAAQPSGRLDSITGIVQGRDGGVWAYGIAGVVQFSREAWAAVLRASSEAVATRLLTMEDGAPGPAQLVRPLPTVLAASDGRLWFAGAQGLAWLDPTRQPTPPSPPPVVIRSVVAGDRTFPSGASVELRDNRDLRVAYTALAPGQPRGLMFRYRLDGAEVAYQDAGTRREAIYTDLPPGRYTFHTEASYDGVHWSRSDPLSVTVAPRLFERTAFQVFCVLFAFALVWQAHRWRVRLLTRRLRWRMDERHRERERIARDLHDTLLQGVQGLILRFQAFADALAKDDRRRAALERTIDRAEALLVEGRDRVKGLRDHAVEEGSLEQQLAALGDDMDPPLHLSTSSRRRRPLNPVVVDEVNAIVREAVINATQHAHARSIRVSIDYAVRYLKIDVQDDGDGFDTDAAPRGDHFGLVGMRERAARIGGRLDVVSRPGKGSAIRLRIPGRVAYATKARTTAV